MAEIVSDAFIIRLDTPEKEEDIRRLKQTVRGLFHRGYASAYPHLSTVAPLLPPMTFYSAEEGQMALNSERSTQSHSLMDRNR